MKRSVSVALAIAVFVVIADLAGNAMSESETLAEYLLWHAVVIVAFAALVMFIE